MLSRKIPGTNGRDLKQGRQLGSIYGGVLTVMAFFFMVCFCWIGINEMNNGKKDIYINQTKQNLFEEPDNEV